VAVHQSRDPVARWLAGAAHTEAALAVRPGGTHLVDAAAGTRVRATAVDVGLAVVPDHVGAARRLTDVSRARAVLAVPARGAGFPVRAARAHVHPAAVDVGLGPVREAVRAGRLGQADPGLTRVALAVAVRVTALGGRAAEAGRGPAAVDVGLGLIPDAVDAVGCDHLGRLRLTGAADGDDAGSRDLEI